MGAGRTWQFLPTFLLLLFLSLLLILLESRGWTRPFHQSIEVVVNPAKKEIYRFFQKKVRNPWLFLTSLPSQAEKINSLQKQVQELLPEKEKARALLEENKILRRQLGAPLPPSWQFLPAQTLGKTDFLTLDKGEKDGVKVGQMVVLENILVGRVARILPRQSQVELPTAPSAKIPVVAQETRARGILQGQFGQSFVLERVPQGETLKENDLLVTTGEGDYLTGLLVGKIAQIERIETEVFQKAQVIPLLDYQKLETVFLVFP